MHLQSDSVLGVAVNRIAIRFFTSVSSYVLKQFPRTYKTFPTFLATAIGNILKMYGGVIKFRVG